MTGASADAETGSRASTEPCSTVSALTGFDPARIGDLPERLFAHSMELVGDDEEDDPSALFYEIQDAVRLLAEIRNELAHTETCEVCDTPDQCASGATQCYLSGEFVAGAERTREQYLSDAEFQRSRHNLNAAVELEARANEFGGDAR